MGAERRCLALISHTMISAPLAALCMVTFGCAAVLGCISWLCLWLIHKCAAESIDSVKAALPADSRKGYESCEL